MKKTIRITLLSLAIAFGISTAQANDMRPYVGVGAGMFNLDAGFGSTDTFGGFADFGVNISDHLAAELRVGTSGTASLNVGGVPTENSVDYFFSYLAKVKLPVNDSIGVYGLLGGTTMKAKFAFPGLVTFANTSTDLSYGVGVDFMINDQMKIGAEWVQYAKQADLTSPTFPGLDVYGISATLNYSF